MEPKNNCVERHGCSDLGEDLIAEFLVDILVDLVRRVAEGRETFNQCKTMLRCSAPQDRKARTEQRRLFRVSAGRKVPAPVSQISSSGLDKQYMYRVAAYTRRRHNATRRDATRVSVTDVRLRLHRVVRRVVRTTEAAVLWLSAV